MKMGFLDSEKNEWIRDYLQFENGYIEWTVLKNGVYEIISKSRNSNNEYRHDEHPGMGVTIELKLDLQKVSCNRL